MPKVVYESNKGLFQIPGEGFAISGDLSVSGITLNGHSFNITTVVTSSLITAASQQLIFGNALNEGITLTLPDASSLSDGFDVRLKKVDTSNNPITVSGSNSQTIDDFASKIITEPYTALHLVVSASNWYII